MKKLFKILVILSIAVLFISCGSKVTSEEAEEKIAQHMYERYGEEFEVGYAMIDGYTKGDRDVTWYIHLSLHILLQILPHIFHK